MVQPQVVEKYPITAARFNGGSDSASKIIQWARHNGDNAVHHEAVDNFTTGSAEMVEIEQLYGGRIPVLIGQWVVYENGTYLLYQEDLFFKIFQTDKIISAERDRWGTALKLMTEGTMSVEGAQIATGIWGPKKFLLANPEVEAIQFPTKQKFEADKDYEERIRKVAAFIVNNGGEVTDQGKDFLGIDLNRAGEDTLRDKQWIVKDSSGALHHVDDNDFRATYVGN